MRLRLLLFFLFLSTNAYLHAQYSETIVSDRPGLSNSPNTIGKMVLQIQTGIHLDGAKADNYKYNGFQWPALLRFGITERIDLMTLWGYQSEKAEYFNMEYKVGGTNIADFGLRFNIFEETENAPALGFEVFYKTKLRSADYKPDHPSAILNLMASKSIADIFSITANLGSDFDGNGGPPSGFYTLNFAVGVNDELSVFFENYSYFTTDDFDTYFNIGGGYLLNSDLQLDLYSGIGYNNDTFSYLVSAGVSYRITRWRKDE